MKTSVALWCAIAVFISISITAQAQYKEKYRPQYHFSPAKGWMGDPDGLVLTEGKYHLFWWGHAISDDLVHWEELPYPMKGGDGRFSYFSGSVVVDKENTSGFGKNSMVAFYTRHLPGDSLPETQAISISSDRTYFNYYNKNPVLDIGKIFFRDPQVFWYSPGQKWVMVVALSAEQKIQIYDSRDLKTWNYCSTFSGLGAQSAFWECPDLFEVPVSGSLNLKKWVLLVGRGPNNVQYFVGEFDGSSFHADIENVEYLKAGLGLNGKVFDGFEFASLNKWTIDGDAFTIGGSKDSIGSLGKGYLSSESNPVLKGKLTSEEFPIKSNAINFLIAGASNIEQTNIALVVNGKVVRTATANGTPYFKWQGWDVSEYRDKVARIQITDQSKAAGGFLSVDHILFSDQALNHNLEHALWMDYGQDYYATRTWRDYDNLSNNRSVAIAWMGNWNYSRTAPTSWGKGFQSIPRDLELKKGGNGYRIVQSPVSELKKLRGDYHTKTNITLSSNSHLLYSPPINTYEMDLLFEPGGSNYFGVDLLVGEGRRLRLSYNPSTSELCLDRTNCTDFISDPEFTAKFAAKMRAPVSLQNGLLKLKVFIDQSSVEIFAGTGEVVISAVTFPSVNQREVYYFSEGGKSTLKEMKVWQLKSIWQNKTNK